jgi:hypothetical protein
LGKSKQTKRKNQIKQAWKRRKKRKKAALERRNAR